MCGRFTIATPAQQLADLFGTTPPADLVPRYNVAPTQTILTVRTADDGKRSFARMRWGLIPSWTKPGEKPTAPLINARGETVATKPSFRSSFKKRRCLIPADGFYEWKQVGTKKQPYHIHRPNGALFAFAGLWDRWQPAEGDPVESCTIITTDANDALRTLHERMPVILMAEDYEQWLDTRSSPAELEALLRPLPHDALELTEVRLLVNNSRVDDPKCVEVL